MVEKTPCILSILIAARRERHSSKLELWVVVMNFLVKVGEGISFGLGFILISAVMQRLFAMGICGLH